MRQLHGVTTLECLEEDGLTHSILRRRPEYVRLSPGVYALPGARRDFWFYAAAARAVAGDTAIMTGEAALHAHGVLSNAPKVIEVCVPESAGSREARPWFRVRRSSHMPSPSVTIAGLRCAPVAYAIGDFAHRASDRAVAYAITRALAQGLVTLESLREAADRRGRFPGSARLRRVLRDFADETSHSRRERRLRAALRRRGVIVHAEPHDIHGPDGKKIAQADIAVVGLLLDIEVDGPHHLNPEQASVDRRRDRDLQLLGWIVLRFTIYDIDEDVDKVADEIVRHIERLGALESA